MKLLLKISSCIFILLPMAAKAQNAALDKLEKVRGPYADYQEDTFSTVIGTVIKGFLSVLGIIFIILIIYAGFNWMTAAGDESKVTKAKTTIQRAIIGLVVIVGSYAIWNFIAERLIYNSQ